MNSINGICLDDLDYATTAGMQVLSPAGGETGMVITFGGPSHPKTRAQTRRLHEIRQRDGLVAPQRFKTQGQVESENVLLVAERIVGWSGYSRRENGEVVDVPYSHDAAMKLLVDPAKGWLFAQCVDFLGGNAFVQAIGEPVPAPDEKGIAEPV